MKNYDVTKKEIIFIGIVYISSFSFLFATSRSGKNDTWICIIISAILTIPTILAIHLLFTYPGKNFFEVIEDALGKILGKFSIVMLILLSTVVINSTLFELIDFIQIVLLFYTPIVVMLFCILITVYFMLHKSPKVMINFGQFVFMIALLFFFLSTAFILKNSDFRELLPIAHNNWNSIAIGTLEASASSFSMIIFIPCLFDHLKDRKKIYKPLGTIVALSLIIILVLAINNLTVLGATEKSKFYFPKHELHRIMGIGTMFQRIEILLSSLFILTEIFKLSLYIYFLLRALQHLLSLSNYKVLLIPTLFMAANNMLSQHRSVLVFIDKESIYTEFMEFAIIYLFSFMVIFSSAFKKLFKT